MTRAVAILALVALGGCYYAPPVPQDRDGDGVYMCDEYYPFYAETYAGDERYPADAFSGDCDCNDENPEISPKATEILDDCVDDDCDGALGYDDQDDTSALKEYLAPDEGLGGSMLCATADSEANPHLGAAIVTAENEGEPALVVGAPKRDHAGVVYVVPNSVMKNSRGDLLAVEQVFEYSVKGDDNSEAGSALALLDVDDGSDDGGVAGDELFIGAPAQSLAGTGARGAVFMLSAPDMQDSPTLTFEDNTGCPDAARFCIVGDDTYTGTRLGASLVTGVEDGEPYLLVSAPGYLTTDREQAVGAIVRVTHFDGRQTLGDRETADSTLSGRNRGEGFGAAMVVAHLDGDGEAQVIVSANGSDGDNASTSSTDEGEGEQVDDGVAGGALYSFPLYADWGPVDEQVPIAVGDSGVTGLGTALAVAPNFIGSGYDAIIASTSCPPSEETSCNYQVHVLTPGVAEGQLDTYMIIDWTDQEGGLAEPANLLVRSSLDSFSTLFIAGPTSGGGGGALWVVPSLADNESDRLHLDDDPPITMTSGLEGDPFESARLGSSMARAWWDTDDDDGLAVGAPQWSNSSGAVIWFSGGSLF